MTDFPNVFVLSADSLRLDRTLSSDVMPFLTELGSDATRFTNVVANGPFTPASFPTLLASRYASSIEGIGLPEEGGVSTIAEELKRQGYRTALWSDNKFVGGEYNYDRGYDVGSGYEKNLRDRVRQHIDEDGLLFKVLEFGYMRTWKTLKNAATDSHYYSTAGQLHTKAQAWLNDQDPDDGPIHLWLHYMDPHHPYEPAEAFMPHDNLEVVTNRTEANNLTRRAVRSAGQEVTEAELRDVRRLYDAECEYLDEQLRSFVEWLESEGWLGADDLLVVTSDHGEVLYDWNEWGVLGHENVFTEECTRVPLIFRNAKLPTRDIQEQASLVDLLPTVLDMAGLNGSDELFMGTSLTPIISGESSGRSRVFYDGTLNYHGVRDADGRKVFNCEYFGSDGYVQTRYGGSTVAYEETLDGDPDEELLSYIDVQTEECAELAEESKGIDPNSLQVKQHMRDLGYLE